MNRVQGKLSNERLKAKSDKRKKLLDYLLGKNIPRTQKYYRSAIESIINHQFESHEAERERGNVRTDSLGEDITRMLECSACQRLIDLIMTKRRLYRAEKLLVKKRQKALCDREKNLLDCHLQKNIPRTRKYYNVAIESILKHRLDVDEMEIANRHERD